VARVEHEREHEQGTQRTVKVNIPHFWGWFAFVIVLAVVILLTVVRPFIVPKSIVLITAAVFALWWLLGGLFFRVRFAKVIRKQRRSGLRVGGWALDGWHARHQRHGSYWRAMRSWIR
jgi:Flp pilus assembly protein TadB